MTSATATCLAGEVLLGGGGRVTATGGQSERIRLVASHASSANVWTVTGVINTNVNNANDRMIVTPYVVCTS